MRSCFWAYWAYCLDLPRDLGKWAQETAELCLLGVSLAPGAGVKTWQSSVQE